MKEKPKNLLTKTLITLILALTLTWFHAAQARADGTITGVAIQDPWTSNGVTVKVTGNGITKSTIADSNDRFSVTVPAGTGYFLTLSKTGYYDRTITGITIADGQTIDFSTNGGGRDIFLYQTMQITTAPQNQAVSLGETANFRLKVMYGGVFPYSFQWFKDGKNLTGRNSNSTSSIAEDSLRIPNVSSADRGAYTVVCTDAEGHTVTASATLKVNDLRIRNSGFSSATSLAVDNQNGNVYLEDGDFIKVIKNDGETVTLKTSFKAQRMTLDNAGNIYAVGTINGSDYFIYKISADGSTTAIPVPFNNDWGGIAVDGSGNIYISRRFSNLIRKVTINPDGTSSATELDSVSTNWYGIAADQAGNVYVIDDVNKVVKKIDVSGAITTWGSGFSDPRDVATDQAGNLYVVDGSTVKKIAPDGQTVTDVASFTRPSKVVVGSDGTVYVKDLIGTSMRGILKKITPEGKIITIGISVCPYNGQVTTVDSSGNVYIADHGVRIFTPDGIQFPYGNFLPGELYEPNGFQGSAMDRSGNIYVSASIHGGVYKFSQSGSELFATILYPCGIIVDDSDNDNVYVLDHFGYPADYYEGTFTLRIFNKSGTKIRDITGFTGGAMTRDSSGHIYIAGGDTITEINAADLRDINVTDAAELSPVKTIKGFTKLHGIAVDDDGTIYVTEAGNNAVKEITPDGKIIVWDSLNNDGNYYDSSGHFYQPSGINLDSQGNIYVINGKYGLTVIRPVLGVAYNPNGSNSGSVPADPGNYYYGQSATVLGQGGLIRQGYSFSGWNTATDGSGTAYAAGAQLPIRRNNVTLYASWTPIGPIHTVNVTTAAGGTVSGGGSYAEGATVTVTAAPASGYTFVNWTLSGVPACTTPLYSFTLGQSDVSLTANFRLTASGNVTIDIAAVPSVTPPVVDQYITNYLPETAEYFGYVTWSPDEVYYFQRQNQVYTATITLAPKPGYTLEGVPANFFRVAGATSVSNAAGSGVITAVFPATGSTNTYPSYYYLHFESGSSGGITAGTDGYYPPGMAITIAATPYKNYRFDKWSSSGGGTFTNANNATATFIMPASDVSITASYKLGAGTSRVSYDGNGNNSGSAPADANNYVYGQTAAVLGNPGSLRKNGYTFSGWNTATDGSGRFYAPGVSLEIGLSDIKLYARWIVNPTYTIAAINNQDLTTLTKGYAAGSQETRTITITRTGSGDLFNLVVSLSGTHAGSFSITQPVVTVLNQGTPSATFTMKAKDGLAAGTYTATVTVTATNMTGIGFTITQQVNDPNLTIVATPSFIIPGGSYNTAQAVPITCATDGAEIRYTTTGDDPTQASALYTGPVLITGTAILKAKAFKNGWNPSEIASQEYTINSTIIKFQPGNSDSPTSPNQLLTAQNIEGDLAVQYNSATLWLGKGKAGKISDIWLYYPNLIGDNDTAGQLKSGSNIIQAKLVLTLKDSSGNINKPYAFKIYRITDPDTVKKGAPYFGSDGIRNGLDFKYRDHRPGRNIPWSDSAADITGILNDSTNLEDSFELVPAVCKDKGYNTIELDVTASVRKWATGAETNQGWFLIIDSTDPINNPGCQWYNGDQLAFYGATESELSKRPHLEVTCLSGATQLSKVNLKPAVPGNGQVTLTWDSTNSEWVRVVRKEGMVPGSPQDGTLVSESISNSTGLTDGNLTNGTIYYYAVFRSDASRDYSPRSWVKATPFTGPIKTPTGLNGQITGNQFKLNWINPVDANTDWLIIEKQADSSGSWETVVYLAKDQTQYTLDLTNPSFNFIPNTNYYFRIKAVNSNKNSADSTSYGPVMTPNFLKAPTIQTWQIISAGRVNLTWTDTTGETAYRVDVCQNDTNHTVLWSLTLPANATFCSVTGLNPGTEYVIKVVAVGNGQEAAAWTEVIKTTTDFKGGML